MTTATATRTRSTGRDVLLRGGIGLVLGVLTNVALVLAVMHVVVAAAAVGSLVYWRRPR